MKSMFNYSGLYKCECGAVFENRQKFNGHKSQCKIHNIEKYGNTELLDRRKIANLIPLLESNRNRSNIAGIKKQQDLEQWVSEQHHCEKCGSVMTTKFGSGRFCSRSCANNKEQTPEINAKRSATLMGKPKVKRTIKKTKVCKYCGCEIKSGIVCVSCKETVSHQKLIESGKKSAAIRCSRSKSEIYFCELCEQYFHDVKHNEPMFNGWDADIIIEDIKMAVLWNGPWHFRHVMDGVSLK